MTFLIEESADLFQLTPSRRATASVSPGEKLITISTHALTEGDSFQGLLMRSYQHFNSRPHGGRLFLAPLPSVRHISTHALTEGDIFSQILITFFYLFQLTPSRRAT